VAGDGNNEVGRGEPLPANVAPRGQ
jgi:hypothetical protein